MRQYWILWTEHSELNQKRNKPISIHRLFVPDTLYCMQLTESKQNKINAPRMIIKVCGFESDEAFLKFVEDLKLEVFGYNGASDEV